MCHHYIHSLSCTFCYFDINQNVLNKYKRLEQILEAKKRRLVKFHVRKYFTSHCETTEIRKMLCVQML